jgi:hypothetical protein
MTVLLAEQNASVRELVDSRRVLANAVLARHYGLPDVAGSVLRELKLPEGSPFGGLWTQPAVMKVTANGTNTSPVKRGVFIAERLLGVHIPPPPPNIEPISSDTSSAASLKEKLALHAGKGSCAACHAKFDGYGFALESFDPAGNFREFYRMAAPDTEQPSWRNHLPVDASGTLPEGRPFADIKTLRKLLAEHPEQLAHGVASHLVTYGTGARPLGVDTIAIEKIAAQTEPDAYGFRSLLHAVIQSDLFRTKGDSLPRGTLTCLRCCKITCLPVGNSFARARACWRCRGSRASPARPRRRRLRGGWS